MSVTILILTYNSSKFIPELLANLTSRYTKEIKAKRLQILIADNNSQDDTEKQVKKFSDLVTFTQNGGNLGYAAGNNKASEKATGDILVILNPDTKLTDGDIMNIEEEFKNEKAGIVGGKIINWDSGRELSCGKFYTLLNVFLLCLGLEEKLGVRFAPIRKTKVDFVSGAFLAIKTELYQRLGGFDEHFFMYIEDQELCYRVKQEGLEVMYSPFATLQHMGQGSSNRTFAVVNIYKGLYYFHKKHMGNLSAFLVKTLLKTKAFILVNLGRVIHNQYLVKTYEEAYKVF